jgi:hypothetical protein
MLTHKSVRLRQLAGGTFEEYEPSPRSASRQTSEISCISKHDEDLADFFLRSEAAAARSSQSLLRRVKSKLTKPDRAIVLKALSRVVQNNDSVNIAQIYIHQLSSGVSCPRQGTQLPDRLLATAVANGNLEMVKILAPYTDVEAVTAALTSLEANRHADMITILLENGADVNLIGLACLLDYARHAPDILQLAMSASQPLHHQMYGQLCLGVVKNGLWAALGILLGIVYHYQVYHHTTSDWTRDDLLLAAVDIVDKNLFFHIAEATSTWMLKDYSLFAKVLECNVEVSLGKDMLEALLCLSDTSSPSFSARTEVQNAICICVNRRMADVLRLLRSYGIRSGTEPLILACQRADDAMLDMLLQGGLHNPDSIVGSTSSLRRGQQGERRTRIIARLLQDDEVGAWKHDELIRAVHYGRTGLVESLLARQASINYKNGQALVHAVSACHLAIVQQLLTRPIKLPTLRSAFLAINFDEHLSSRLLTKLLIGKGLSGQCLDDKLNNILSDYSEGRDPELLQILLDAGGRCTAASLANILDSQQWVILGMLLDRRVTKEVLEPLFMRAGRPLSSSAAQVLMRSQAVSGMPEQFFREVVQQAFDQACTTHHHETALLLCTMSKVKLSISSAVVGLQEAMKTPLLDYAVAVLEATSHSYTEIDALWTHAVHYLARDNFATLRALLKFGVSEKAIGAAVVAAIENHDRPLVRILLEEVDVPKCAGLCRGFDYEALQYKPGERGCVSGDKCAPFLAPALAMAIRIGDVEICDMLCTSGAPLVHEDRSMIDLAVTSNCRAALMAILKRCTQEAKVKDTASYALWLATEHKHVEWIPDIAKLGGSVIAYECRSINTAAKLEDFVMLDCLLEHDSSSKSLITAATTLVGRLVRGGDDAEAICRMLQRVHTAGYQNQALYTQALFALSRYEPRTTKCVDILLGCGASIGHNEATRILNLWEQGSYEFLLCLVPRCSSKKVLDQLLKALCDRSLHEHNEQRLGETQALPLLNAILERGVSQPRLDQSLEALAVGKDIAPKLPSLITKLLEAGACFADGAGRVLYQVCRLCDPQIQEFLRKRPAPLRTRLAACVRLFLHQNSLGELPLVDGICMAGINFPASDFECLLLEGSDVVSLISAMLHPEDKGAGTSLMSAFFATPHGQAVFHCQDWSVDDSTHVEELFAAISEQGGNSAERATYLLRAMQLGSRGVLNPAEQVRVSLDQPALDRLLIKSLEQQNLAVVETLLEVGADANSHDTEGRTALQVATLANIRSAMAMLIARGAGNNDGSIHIATCLQLHEAMQVLIEAGHSQVAAVEQSTDLVAPHGVRFDLTPKEAFLRYPHPDEAKEHYETTLAVLLCGVKLPDRIWTTVPDPLHLALRAASPFEMTSALLWYLPEKVLEPPLMQKGCFMYSLLSFAERDEDLLLTEVQRVQLSERLDALGFKRTYYVYDGGDQPEDAINVPRGVESAKTRARRTAWSNKDCAVCNDKPEHYNDIHGALTRSCHAIHSWTDDIICTDCLHGYLESQMFPQSDDRFPSATVKCWAANCKEALPHSILQSLAPIARFQIYDLNLAQLYLNDGTSTVRCASPDCSGAAWLDPEEDKDITIISCPRCSVDTCIQCNQLYAKHQDMPCPQGEEARGAERRREEEAATMRVLASGKKCPKCQLVYERISGCDHIVCGKDAHSNARSREFLPFVRLRLIIC